MSYAADLFQGVNAPMVSQARPVTEEDIQRRRRNLKDLGLADSLLGKAADWQAKVADRGGLLRSALGGSGSGGAAAEVAKGAVKEAGAASLLASV